MAEQLKKETATSLQDKDQPDIMPTTLLERFINTLHVPYFPASVAIAFFASDFGMMFFRYLDTWNLTIALDLPIQQAGNVVLPDWINILSSTLFFFIFVFIFYFIRASRRHVTEAKKPLGSLLPKHGPSYEKIFRHHFHGYVMFLSMGGFVIPFLGYFWLNFQYSTGYFSLIHGVLSTFIVIIMLATILWIFVGTLRGLYDFGKQPLNLISFYEDSMLGLGHAGKLSLTMSAYYFLMILLSSLALATNPFQNLNQQLGIGALSILGGLMFFLSLRSCHERMVKRKKFERDKIRRNFVSILENTNRNTSSQKSIDDLWRLNALEVAERKMMDIHTWPFDTGIIVRLVTLTGLPILLSVLGKLIQVLLQI